MKLCNRLQEEKDTYDDIPRLVYRQDNKITATKSIGRNIDLNIYVSPDHDDYIKCIKNNSQRIFRFPLETKRGCHWNRCKFCYLNKGYSYRKRPENSVTAEIVSNYKKYGIEKYWFVDNDFVGHSISEFEKLLDMIINASIENSVQFDFAAEIIPSGMNSRIIKKIASAGFSLIQIGYEGISDALLETK